MAKLGRLNRRLFDKIRLEGRFSPYPSPYFSAKIGRLSDLPPDTSLVSVVAPTKSFKQAVERNRAKRRVRTAVNELKSSLKPGFGLIFFCRPKVNTIPHQDLINEIMKALP